MYLTDLAAAARATRRGLTTSRALVDAALRRYDETEPTLHAFAWLDPERARRIADERDHAPRAGALHGVPIGVKDIVDVAGLPAERGSALFAGRVAERDATAAARLEAAGAVILGKTITAELAYFSPGPTTNPHDPTRTPGGSSMGSAAAVAAGVVPAAVASQTVGSTIRPAAFCGVVGFKPTYGRLPLDGVMSFAPTLDHLGAIASTVEGCALLAATMSDEPLEDWWTGVPDRPPRFAAVWTSDWESVSDAMRARAQADVDALALDGDPIEWPALPPGLDDGPAVLRTIMAFEAVGTIGRDIARDPERVSQVARSLCEEGARIPRREYDAALRERERLVREFAAWAEPYDAVLTPPALGEAPTRETTGDPRMCARWTLVGAPAVVIPTGRGPSRLPLGLQLVGAPGQDRRTLAAAAWAEARIATR